MKPISKAIPWTTADVLKATGGSLLCGNLDCAFEGISIDSRTVCAHDLFVAIKGQVHDGHSFSANVINSGVRGLVINQNQVDESSGASCRQQGIVCIAVADTTRALGDMAAYQRKRSNVSLVAITGSNGKTSTRKITAGVVARCFNTLSTSGNLNNEIGLPLTLLNISFDHQWAVVELGMNHAGEIARLAEICSPDIGVITNIGPAHLEGLGSLDAVMQAKGELLQALGPNGTAVLNADDPSSLKLADQTPVDVLLYGLSKDAVVRAESIQKKGLGLRFMLVLPSESIPIDLGSPGGFMVSNALAAAAVGYLAGASIEKIKAGLEDFKPVHGRLNILKTRRGINIIDDTYNANPASMSAAIVTLQSLKENSRGILVAGDMLELGEYSEVMHREIGALASGAGLERLYATGRFADAFAAGARDIARASDEVKIGSKEQIVEDLTGWLKPGDWVLVKGSRSMAMEDVVKKLQQWANS